MENDIVNHPAHYTQHPSGVECIDIAQHLPFTLGNAVKYLWRANHKNGHEDLQKALWYLDDIYTHQWCMVYLNPKNEQTKKLIGRILDTEATSTPLGMTLMAIHYAMDGLFDAADRHITLAKEKIESTLKGEK